MINKLHLNHLRVAKLAEFLKEVYALILEIGADKLGVTKQVETLFAPNIDALDDVIKRVMKSSATERLAETDDKRDNAAIGIPEVLRGLLRHFNANIVAAANELLILFNTYGNIARMPRDEETTLISNLVADLKRAKYSKFVELLQLEEWVDELERLNNEYKAQKKLRMDEKYEKTDRDLIEARSNAIDGYRIICNLAVAFAKVDKNNPVYAEFIRKLNIIISGYGGAGGTGKTTTPKEPGGSGSADYPDAKEWIEDLPFMGVENGDIYYILVDGKKVFYKLVDKQKFFWHPESEKAAGGWEKL